MLKFFIFSKDRVSYVRYKIFSFKRLLFFLLIQIIIAFIFINLISTFYRTSKEKKLEEKITYLLTEYQDVNNRLMNIDYLLGNIKDYDSVIYTALFDYVPNEKEKFESYYLEDSLNNEYLDMVNSTNQRITTLEDKLEKQKYILADVFNKTKTKEDMISHIPSIQPVSNKDLKYTSSGWGFRIHPIYRIKLFHYGMDFVIKEGTDVFATGDAKVISIQKDKRGYGNSVILDHGYGYKTLYGHLNKIKVKVNQKIKRGEVIAFSGNTGTSTGPHLHYEVLKDNKKINPINFYFNDLSIDQYSKMIEISSKIMKSLD